MSGKFEAWDVCVTPPITNGNTKTPKVPQGCRAVVLTTTPAEVALSLDVFRAMPDAGANAATADFTDRVLMRVFADGGDVMLLFGAAGAALTPDPAATNASNPANVCEAIPQNTYVDFWVNPKTEASMYVRARAGSATVVRYRLSGPLPGNR